MATDPFTQTILALLMASPAIRAKMGSSGGTPPSVAALEPQPPDSGSSLTPGPTPTPTPPPQIAPPPAQAAAPALEQGPIGRMLGLSPDTSSMFRRIGGGMANIRGNPYGDPFIDMAQGFGGAQATGADQDAAAQAAAAAGNKTAYDRTVASQEQARQAAKDAEESKYKALAETRAQKTADLANRKSAIEIKRLARNNGITDAQMLQIESIAMKAGEGLSGDRRVKAIDEERQRLLDQIHSGEGISGGAGISQPYTSTNPDTGQTLEWRDGQWVDQATGDPYAEPGGQ